VLEIFGMGVYSNEIYIIKNIHSYSDHFLRAIFNLLDFYGTLALNFY
jgi:hypothetical protein